jgi:hypothetical protein
MTMKEIHQAVGITAPLHGRAEGEDTRVAPDVPLSEAELWEDGTPAGGDIRAEAIKQLVKPDLDRALIKQVIHNFSLSERLATLLIGLIVRLLARGREITPGIGPA